MKKKYVSIVLAAALCLGLIGCSSSSSTSSTTAAATEAATEPETTAAETEADDETDADDSSDLTPSFYIGPEATVETITEEYTAADGTTVVLNLSYDYVGIGDDDDHKALSEAVDKWSEQQETDILNHASDLASDAEALGDETSAVYEIEETATLGLNNNQYFSFVLQDCEYTGGAHSNYSYTGITFDSQTGDIVTLDTLINDLDSFEDEVSQYILDQLEADYADDLLDGYNDVIEQAKSSGDFVWYLSDDGMVFPLAPATVLPFSEGPVYITYPNEMLANYTDLQ